MIYFASVRLIAARLIPNEHDRRLYNRRSVEDLEAAFRRAHLSPPAKGNGKCADSNLLAKPNGFSPSTVSSRIFSE
jgi:hypothetical protein